jgi:hypothetical protein
MLKNDEKMLKIFEIFFEKNIMPGHRPKREWYGPFLFKARWKMSVEKRIDQACSGVVTHRAYSGRAWQVLAIL